MNIDKEELLKGYINLKKNKKGFFVYFWDIINNKSIYLANVETFDEGYEIYCNYQINYYKDKHFLLPKHITSNTKSFVYQFKVKMKNGIYKMVFLYSAKSLQEVIEYRKQFIANLL